MTVGLAAPRWYRVVVHLGRDGAPERGVVTLKCGHEFRVEANLDALAYCTECPACCEIEP